MKLLKLIKGRLSSKLVNHGKNKIEISFKKVYKYNIRFKGQNNTIKAGNNFNCSNLELRVIGNNNKIVIGDNLCAKKFLVILYGDNNTITLGNNIKVDEALEIHSHHIASGKVVEIKDKASFVKTQIVNIDPNARVFIGEDCMFAGDTTVYNTDSHSIFQDGKLINQAKDLIVGNHVWVCGNVNILKNSDIADGCILARNALVSGKFETKNAVIAGLPAKVIKTGIVWDRKSVAETIAETKQGV